MICWISSPDPGAAVPAEVELSGILRSVSDIALIVSSAREVQAGTEVRLPLDGRLRAGCVEECAPDRNRFLLWVSLSDPPLVN